MNQHYQRMKEGLVHLATLMQKTWMQILFLEHGGQMLRKTWAICP